MKNTGRMILELLIETEPEKTRSFLSKEGKVTMIPFSGTIRSGIMRGIVEPFGVDTQITNANDVRHMSARYMLTGEDEEGNPCHIYVENNAWFIGDNTPVPFRTVPTFITDSPLLSGYFMGKSFIGEGQRDEEGLWIRFYEAV